MMTIHPLTLADIPTLIQIDPSFRSGSELVITIEGSGLDVRFIVAERPLAMPYDKGRGYAFDPDRRREIASRLNQDGCLLLLVRDDDRPVGLLDAEHADWNNAITLHHLFIDVHYRGRGIGRDLWARLVDFAQTRGADRIHIETQTNNVPACRFYLRMGCAVCGIDTDLYEAELGEIAIFFSYRIEPY